MLNENNTNKYKSKYWCSCSNYTEILKCRGNSGNYTEILKYRCNSSNYTEILKCRCNSSNYTEILKSVKWTIQKQLY